MSRADLDAIRERAEAATEGPWSAANEHGLLGPEAQPAWCVSQMRPGWESMSPTKGYVTDIAETFSDDPDRDPDAEFIAHARTDVPALIAEVERLRKIEAGVEALADEWSKPSPYDGHGMRAPIDPDHAARRLLALLTPTEGETDDR